jgi:exopolyphosphatase/guanosine-5'-triphosphate,3'-diphosphate pyrophosphatase
MKAAIDIGSNSLLLLVVDDAGVVVHHEQRVIGLGKGLGERGVFKTDRMEAAMEVFRAYGATAARFGVRAADVRAVATSASRRALNATSFYGAVRAQTGLRVEIAPGEEEARLTYLGGVSGMDLAKGPVLLCDPGGGSTEVILGEGEAIHFRVSLEIGTVRLTEQYLGYGTVDAGALARLRAHVDEAVSAIELPALPRTAVAVAGTATTLTAADLGLTAYDGAAVHGSSLTAGALRGWVDRLLTADPEERRAHMRVSPERADTVLAGACILLRVLELARKQHFRISDRGLRYALVAR